MRHILDQMPQRMRDEKYSKSWFNLSLQRRRAEQMEKKQRIEKGDTNEDS